jgi:hypothetical protein
VIEIPSTVAFRRLDTGTVLVELATGRYFSLDPVGARCFELLHEGHDLEAAAAVLAAEYDAPAERIRADLDALVDQLAERGLVTRR